MGLFNSGPRGPGGSYVFTPPGAGTYLYHCTIHPTLMNGSIKVPVTTNPTSGSTATAFKIIWAPGPPPTGYVFDVQIKRPGAASFVNFKTAQTVKSTTFHPDAGTGTYSFRARLRKLSGGASSFSPAASISVS